MILADQTRKIEFLHIADNPMICDALDSIDVGSFQDIVGGLFNYEQPVICDPRNKKCFYITGNEIEPKAQYILGQ